MPSVFVDLDGTLVTGDMHHTLFAFIWSLPNPIQRLKKMLLLLLILPFVGLVSILPRCGEGIAIRILCYLAMSGVSVTDCRKAVAGVTASLLKRTIPEVLNELRRHQAEGRKVSILTGNLHPLVEEYCALLQMKCLATVAHEHKGFFSGLLDGPPFVREEKAVAVRALLQDEGQRSDAFAYGNSEHDLAFMLQVGHPIAVRPSRQLALVAQQGGWANHLHDVADPKTPLEL